MNLRQRIERWIWSTSIRRQLIFGVALVHLLLMTLFVVDIVERQGHFLKQRAEHRVLFQADMLSVSSLQQVILHDLGGLAEIVAAFSRDRAIKYAMITDNAGRVLGHTDPSRSGLYLHDKTSLDVLTGTPERKLVHTGDNEVYAAAPVIAVGNHIGWVWVAADLSAEQTFLHYVTRTGQIYVIMALFVGGIMAVILANTITRPLLLLERGAERLARDQLNEPVPVTTENEVGTVTRALNDAMVKLSTQRAELTRARDELELRVDERTAELAQANAVLEQQIRERVAAQEALRFANDQLEERVVQRTAELARMNDTLEREVGERRRAQLALQDANRSLERTNDDLRQFAYVASHDLQEPLRTVASYTNLLGQRYKDKLDADANEFIDYAVQGAHRMQALIRDLLAYSRAGRADENAPPVDANEALRSALTNLESAVATTDASVVADRLPAVCLQQVALVQLFQNLIGNALKYRSERRPEIRIVAEEQPDAWHFSVRDNGIGIEPQHVTRIFGIFKRLHGNKYPGTGIGLAICAKIVERSGGRIWVESEFGSGSTFHFTLPKVEPAAVVVMAKAGD